MGTSPLVREDKPPKLGGLCTRIRGLVHDENNRNPRASTLHNAPINPVNLAVRRPPAALLTTVEQRGWRPSAALMTTAERQPISQNAGLLNKKQLGRRLISFDQYAILVARLYGPVEGIVVQEDRIPGGVTCKKCV